jgi:hypothetical protein
MPMESIYTKIMSIHPTLLVLAFSASICGQFAGEPRDYVGIPI